MDRYQKLEKAKVETPIDENEIRITSKGRMQSYISYAMTLLQDKGSDKIVFKAMGRAINKTVAIVELVKRRIVGLHQTTSIQSTDITDTWEPLEEGLQTLETTRKVSMVTIILSMKELDKTNVGYQPPIPSNLVRVSTEVDYDDGGVPYEGSPVARGRGRFGRGTGRSRGGSSGNGYPSGDYEDGSYVRHRGYTRGRGRGNGYGYGSGNYEDGGYERDRGYYRGRGRGNVYASEYYDDGDMEPRYTRGRGRGRARNYTGRGWGWYNNGPPMDIQYDAGGFNQEAPRGRGRGRGPRGGRGRGFRSDGPIQAAA